jgi:uncharacterized membrane protein YvbJ
MKQFGSVAKPTMKELRTLMHLANDECAIGWIESLANYLKECSVQARDLYSELDDTSELLARVNEGDLAAKDRIEIARALKRLIAFNNETAKQNGAYQRVGIGDCVDGIGAQLKAIKKVRKSLATRRASPTRA